MHATNARALARRGASASLTGGACAVGRDDGGPTRGFDAHQDTPACLTPLRSLDGVRATPARQTGT